MARISIVGNVGRESTIKVSKNGTEYVQFPLAEGSGERTRWYNCTIFNPVCIAQIKKLNGPIKPGVTLDVMGTYGDPTIYTDKNTNEQKVATNVTVFDWRFVQTHRPKAAVSEEEHVANQSSVLEEMKHQQVQTYNISATPVEQKREVFQPKPAMPVGNVDPSDDMDLPF